MAIPKLPGRKKTASNEATASVARKIAMIVDLLKYKCLRFSQYESTYGRDYRSFQRDLQQLRKICGEAGFTLSSITDKEYVELTASDKAAAAPAKKPVGEASLLAAVAVALGEPILRELGLPNGSPSGPNDFFQFVLPRLVEGNDVADTCALLRAACEAPEGRAIVRFRYPERGTSTGVERNVEPFHIMARSGSFYLVGYDRDRKDWRMFTIDRFLSKPVRAGTCVTKRIVPDTYTSKDVLGFIKGGRDPIAVTVQFKPAVAATATSRIWQQEQQTIQNADGSAAMVFHVADVDEVIRWTLGFGSDAWISDPPKAVERARTIVGSIAEMYPKG
jgi:predicted DNA-binding transcriptional regulator YafY